MLYVYQMFSRMDGCPGISDNAIVTEWLHMSLKFHFWNIKKNYFGIIEFIEFYSVVFLNIEIIICTK